MTIIAPIRKIQVELLPNIDKSLHLPIKPSPITRSIYHPEDKLIRRSLYDWLPSLISQLDQSNSYTDEFDEAEKLASIYNQITFIMSCLHDIENTEWHCNNAIQYFNHLSQKTDNPNILSLAVQPWINLARLLRLKGCLNESQEMLDLIIGIPAAHHTSAKIVANAIQTCRNKQFFSIFFNSYVMDTIRNSILSKNLDHVKKLESLSLINPYHQSLIAEATIIIETLDGELNTAYQITRHHYNQGIAIAMPIFAFRGLQIRHMLNLDIKPIVDLLLRYLTRKIDNYTSARYEYLFLFDLYQYLLSEKIIAVEISILEKFFRLFQSTGDEVAEINTLKLLSLYELKYAKQYLSRQESTLYTFLSADHAKIHQYLQSDFYHSANISIRQFYAADSFN